MRRVMIVIICLFTSVVSSFADDSDMIEALRGEGLMIDSAADPLLAELILSDNDAGFQQTGTNTKAETYQHQHGIGNVNTVNQIGRGNRSLVVQVGVGN